MVACYLPDLPLQRMFQAEWFDLEDLWRWCLAWQFQFSFVVRMIDVTHPDSLNNPTTLLID
jgi:hypothetical protein